MQSIATLFSRGSLWPPHHNLDRLDLDRLGATHHATFPLFFRPAVSYRSGPGLDHFRRRHVRNAITSLRQASPPSSFRECQWPITSRPTRTKQAADKFATARAIRTTLPANRHGSICSVYFYDSLDHSMQMLFTRFAFTHIEDSHDETTKIPSRR